jgi:hypothetical protein
MANEFHPLLSLSLIRKGHHQPNCSTFQPEHSCAIYSGAWLVPHLFRVLTMQMLVPWLRYGQLLKDVMGLNKQVNGRVVTSAKKASMYPSWASTVTATSSGPVSSSSLCAWIGRNAKKRSKWVLHYEALISSDKSCAQQRKHDCVYSQLWGLLICPWSFWGLAYNPTDSFKERIVPKKAPNS